MKEFNLEAAINGAKVCTRDGRAARIISYDFNTCDPEDLYPIVAIVRGADEEYLVTYTREGRELANGEMKKDDLFLAPEQHHGWVNVYRLPDGTYGIGDLFMSESEATTYAAEKSWMTEKCVATVKIEWED